MKLDIIKIDLSKLKNDDSIRFFFKEHNIEISKLMIIEIYTLIMMEYKFLFFDLKSMNILSVISIEDYKKNNFNKLEDKFSCSLTLLEKYYRNLNIILNDDRVFENNNVVTKIENKEYNKVTKDMSNDKKHLELKLQECIESEDYLEAARIRDIIKELI